MIIEKRGRGLLLIFPMFRNMILAMFGLEFGGDFSFATYSIISSFSGSGFLSVFAYLFVIPFAVVGLLGVLVAIYMPFNNLRVRVENRQVVVLRRLLFIPIYYKNVDKRVVQSLSLKRIGSTGQGVNKVEHYKIIANMRNNEKMTIAEGVNGEDLAIHFKEYLYKKIKVAEPSAKVFLYSALSEFV